MLIVAMVTLCLICAFSFKKTVVMLTLPDATKNHHVQFSCILPDQFILKWKHSVEKQYWQEVYELTDDTLILTKTYTQTFGAGVPSTGKPTDAPSGYVGQLINQPMPYIDWVVSSNMQGEILAEGQILSIYKRVPQYSNIHIAPAKLSFWHVYRLQSCLLDTNFIDNNNRE